MGMLSKAKKEAPAEQDDDDVVDPMPKEESAEEPEGDEGPNPTAPSDDDGDEEEEGGEDMPPALQPEYKRCVAALYEIMYNNDSTSRNVLDSLDHTSDIRSASESVARTTMLLMHLLDKKLDMSGDVLPYVLLTVVDRLIELLERVHKMKFSDKDVMATVAAAFEGAKQLFPNEQTPQAGAPGADVDAGPDSGSADTGNGTAPPGEQPPGAAGPAPEPAEAPEAEPTEEEAAQ